MSTVKTDAITAVSAGGDLSLDGLGTGGVSIASTLKMTKGGDIASASPLVIDTDGNYFDVTGTTNFAAMTVESGNFFMLQFDSALTITHGSGIEIPGAANLTTATGDRLMCYATAANTVEVMSVETEAAAASGGSWTTVSPISLNGGTGGSWTSLPTGITQLFLGCYLGSHNNADDVKIQLGTSGGTVTSGYVSASGDGPQETDAFGMGEHAAAGVSHGGCIIMQTDSSAGSWTSVAGHTSRSAHAEGGGGSLIALGGTLDRVVISGGTFDGGSGANAQMAYFK